MRNKKICDTQVGQCVQCVAKADCPANNDCIAHACVPYTPCSSSLDCKTGNVCDTQAGRCAQCVVDADCGSDGKKCIGNLCRSSCASDNDCTPMKLLCDQSAGYCVRCMRHQDCDADQYCSQGLCKPDECVPDQTACIDNGVAVCGPAGDSFGAPQSCGEDSCTVSPSGARCEGGGEPDAGAPDGGDQDSGQPTGPCTVTATDYGCNTIPRFPMSVFDHVLDGIGTEFEDVRAVTFTANEAPFREGHGSGDPAPLNSYPEVITFRAAWSPQAFHLHLRVTDPAIHVSTGELWNGDAVDLMLASGSEISFGGVGTCSANALHIGVVPSTTPTATVYASGTGGSRPVLTDWYAVRVLEDAYEMEFKIPWPDNKTLAAGDTIGFHLSVSIQDKSGDGGRELLVTLPVDGTLDKAGGGCAQYSREAAWCDGRAWCRPVLSPSACPAP